MSLCRTCLQENRAQNFISLNHMICESESMKLKDKLITCIPELDLELLDNPMMCLFCIDALEVSYNFKQKCLQTDELIRFKVLTTNDNGSVAPEFIIDLKPSYTNIKVEPRSTEEFNCIESQKSELISTDELQNNQDNVIVGSQDFDISGTNKQEIFAECEVVNGKSVDIKLEPVLTVTNENVILNASDEIKETVCLFSCEICRYVTKTKQKLDRHLQIHTGEKPYKCKKYNFRSVRKKSLKTRMKIYNQDKTFNFNTCELSLKNQSPLNKRRKKSHIGYFECSQCNYGTKRKDHLKKHEQIHVESIDYFECNECGYRFLRKDHLKRHVKIHTGVKPFECSSCHYKAERKDHLKEHIRRKHKNWTTSEELIECSECGIKFTKKSALRLHMKVHND